MNQIPISEIFGPTIQGEGLYTGVPSIFIRVCGCNLRCHFANGSICDTPYTSIQPEDSRLLSDTEILSEVQARAGSRYPHIVITGGEPMLYQKDLRTLIEMLKQNGFKNITIETNGSILPEVPMMNQDIFWSVSPKLQSSCCFDRSSVPELLQQTHKNTRINLKALARIMATENYQLKFVYSGKECLDEIEQLIYSILEYNQELAPTIWPSLKFPREVLNHIWLMPEGATLEQLQTTSESAAQAAIQKGWRFCDRTHIRIWNTKRCV